MSLEQQWAGIAATTIADHIKTVEMNILRNRKVLALLMSKGRISYNHTGESMEWPVRYKEKKGAGYSDGDTISYGRDNYHKKAKLGWRAYNAAEGFTKWDRLKNAGAQAIVNAFSDMAERMTEDMENWFSGELYRNGNDPRYRKNIHGIESFMSAVPVPGNGAAKPTSTFAELNCTPGAVSGRWTSRPDLQTNAVSGWPHGQGDADFDFWSPIIVDVGDTLFDPNTHTFENNGLEAIRFMNLKCRKNNGVKDQLDICFIEDEWYRAVLRQISAKERIVVTNQSAPLVKLGFSDVVNQDGLDITTEFGIPSGVGYGFNIDKMELCSQQSKLFVPDGPNYNQDTKSFNFSIDFFGNCRWNPKYFGKLINLSHPELN